MGALPGGPVGSVPSLDGGGLWGRGGGRYGNLPYIQMRVARRGRLDSSEVLRQAQHGFRHEAEDVAWRPLAVGGEARRMVIYSWLLAQRKPLVTYTTSGANLPRLAVRTPVGL